VILSWKYRRAMVHVSIALCASSLLLLPLTARSAHRFLGAVSGYVAVSSPLPLQSSFPRVRSVRDPFLPPPSERVEEESRQGAVIVRAIALGSRPSALLQNGPTTQLVVPGDRVGDTFVKNIGEDGITLDDGTVLKMAEPR
jgi:hypothetical protein